MGRYSLGKEDAAEALTEESSEESPQLSPLEITHFKSRKATLPSRSLGAAMALVTALVFLQEGEQCRQLLLRQNIPANSPREAFYEHR